MKHMDSQPALEKCPFCGGEAKVIKDGNLYLVNCTEIDCYAASHPHFDPTETIAKWNRRVPVAQPPQAMPQPDWRQAPDWATWWSISADGCVNWYDAEPRMLPSFGEWGAPESVQVLRDGMIDIPLGIDWRLLKQRRTASEGEAQ